MIRLSTRQRFRKGHDEGWDKYAEWMRFEDMEEVRSLDSLLNPQVDDCGDYLLDHPSMITWCLEQLPNPNSESEYFLLAFNLEQVERPEPPSGWSFLGHDLCDEFATSSILNCGPWTGTLAPIARRMNNYGLLQLMDAREAQELLPTEWGETEPHADVKVWALFERQSIAGKGG